MKKLYVLLGSALAVGSISAQIPAQQLNGMWMGEAQSSQSSKVLVDQADNGGFGQARKGVSGRGVDYKSFIEVGSTYYDLQTNYAMPRRLVLHPDGAVSATWTTSPSDAVGFPGRGAGYNFADKDGNWGSPTATKVEPTQRSGWPSIGILADGSVFTIAHDASNGGFYFTKSSSASSRPSTTSYVLDEAPYKPIWGRAASNGDNIHFICSYTDSSAPGEKRAPTRQGVFAPMVYSRSTDGGQTWDKKHTVFPGFDSTLTNYGGADQYAIDVKGNTVAVVNGDLLQGVVVFKSTDNGDNWTRIMADSFPYAPWTDSKQMLDTPLTNDGTVDVLIDDNGQLHVFWGLGRVFNDDTTDGSYSFYPGLQGIVHWSESTGNSQIIASGASFDRTDDGFNSLDQSTYASLSSGNVPSGLNTVARLGNTSAMRQPVSSIGADGTIYCVFSVPMEEDFSDLGANFRDIGVVYSTDGGATWSAEQNITQRLQREDDFPTVARQANDFLHVMWQQDEIAGTNLQNNSASFGNHPVILNTMYYQAIPVSEIKAGNIGMLWGVNVEKPNTGEVMVVNQNYPNPFEDNTQVTVYLTRPGDVTIEVRNAMGALVKTEVANNLMKGNHVLTIHADDLTSGVYTYTLISGGSSVSRTMMVK